MKAQTWVRCLAVVVIGLLWAGSGPASGGASSGAIATLDAPPGVDLPPGAQAALDEALLIDPWTQAAKLTASARAPADWFGYAVALSGDVLVIGAPETDPGGTRNAGRRMCSSSRPRGGRAVSRRSPS